VFMFHSKLALLLIQAWELLFLFRDLFHSKLALLLTVMINGDL